MIQLGPAGSGGLGNLSGVEKVKSVGLDAMEVEFTYGVNMSDGKASEIGALAKKLKISLSVHAPYYINLASLDKSKIAASKKRILMSCKKAHLLGAKYVVFHAGFYQNRSKNEIYDIIKRAMVDLCKSITLKKWDVALAPETTGKASQFGDLDELLRLRKETGCELCVDFAHLLAREGKVDYASVFRKLKGIKHLHAHFSGIEFTKKGERRHLVTEKKAIIDLLKHIIKQKIDVTIINESPDPLNDSLKTKLVVKSLLHQKKER
ncbi:MAG: TIM barrel protein [Candidatus Omnitrophota bacterium]